MPHHSSVGSVIVVTVWKASGGGGARSWRLNSRTFIRHQKRTTVMVRTRFTVEQKRLYGNRNRASFQTCERRRLRIYEICRRQNAREAGEMASGYRTGRCLRPPSIGPRTHSGSAQGGADDPYA